MIKKLAVLFTVFFLSLTAAQAAEWTVTNHVEKGVVQMKTTSEGGSFSYLCTDDNCNIIIQPKDSCKPRIRYPILVNSATRVGAVPAVCVSTVEDGNFLITQDPRPFLKSLLTEESFQISYPVGPGGFNIIEVGLTGALNKIGKLIPENVLNEINRQRQNGKSPKSNLKAA